ncbi:hypothetical protein LCGC14_1245790 [marine sediment metagenome]|uniref:Endonuclease/exonuclease/phosphatase domain-containing protein n=1 Tax=marine sediment metagenome TaxID=412755 RepID=A0A0F9P8G2_9ZZZZ
MSISVPEPQTGEDAEPVDSGKSARKPWRRRAICAVTAALGLCVVWFVANRVLAPGSSVRVYELGVGSAGESPFKGTLRIAAYNIAHGRGLAKTNWQVGKKESQLQRLRAIGQFLRREKIDIAILNEVDFDSFWTSHVDQARVIAQEAGFPYWAEQRNVDAAIPLASLRWGNAVLSRYPIAECRMVDFPARARWIKVVAGHKRGLLCKVKLTGPLAIQVLAVHLDHVSESVRIDSVERIDALRARIALPMILAGDFNSTPREFPKAHPDANGRTAMSCLLAKGAYRTAPTGKAEKSDLTFPSTDPKSVIDWILIPKNWQVLAKSVPASTLSDHNPVIMDVRMSGQ